MVDTYGRVAPRGGEARPSCRWASSNQLMAVRENREKRKLQPRWSMSSAPTCQPLGGSPSWTSGGPRDPSARTGIHSSEDSEDAREEGGRPPSGLSGGHTQPGLSWLCPHIHWGLIFRLWSLCGHMWGGGTNRCQTGEGSLLSEGQGSRGCRVGMSCWGPSELGCRPSA